MNPVLFIRKHILQLTQVELADTLDYKQASVSRWEAQGYFPADVQPKVRALCLEACPDWQDSWFFEVPDEVVARFTAKAA